MNLRALAVAVVMIVSPAQAHDWYPAECCKDGHCRPIPCDQVTTRLDHVSTIYVWKEPVTWVGSAQFVERLYGMNKVHPSPDGQCHACVANGTPTCLFLPREVS